MSRTLDDLIAKAKQLEKNGDEQGAMSLAEQLLASHMNDIRVWLLHAHLHALSRNYIDAVADMSRAIEINVLEPHLFFTRGTYRFALGEDKLAVEDFTEGLRLCDYHKNDYYRDTMYFWRAEALLKLGKKVEALSDLASVPDDFQFWTDKLRTKADLIADCGRLG